jgi:hypothetical protein
MKTGPLPRIFCWRKNDSGTLPLEKGFENMKYIGRIWIIVLTLGFASAKAQSCTITPIWEYPGETPSILGLIMGNYSRPTSETWAYWSDQIKGDDQPAIIKRAYAQMNGGNALKAIGMLSQLLDSVGADSAKLSAAAPAFEAYGFARILNGGYPQAIEALQIAQGHTSGPNFCRVRITLLTARYLKMYGTAAPLWPNFNGGFYNYLADSLGWKEKQPDADQYILALNAVSWLLRIDVAQQPLYLELIGDLLAKEPGKFNSHYLAGLAYLRAGLLTEDAREKAFERKGMFALEAPNIRDDRFNQYRWTQLRKALIDDVDHLFARQDSLSKAATQNAKSGQDPMLVWGGQISKAPISAAMLETEKGRLPSMLVRARAEIEGPTAPAGRYAGDVDLAKAVKKDTRFNLFAAFLILTIVGAVVFFWVQLRRNTRQQS